MSKLFGKTMKTKMMGNKAMISKSTNDFIMNELLNSTITKETFLKIGMIELPDEIKENPIQVLALSFNRDSKVGPWTNKAMNICTALPSEFVNESGVGASKHFTKAFLCTTKHGKKENYDRIFEEELNVHTFTLKINDKFVVSAYYVSNKEINIFKDAIASLDLTKLTVEDVINIQADLWYLFRAWQESSIDMTKDKEKQYATSMDEILGLIKVRTGVKFQDIKTNEYTLKASKYNKELKVEEWPCVEIDFAEYDEEDDDFCETTLSEMQHSIRITAEQELQVVADAFMNADITKYEVYNQAACDYPQLAMTVMDIVKIIKDYNNVTKEEKKEGRRLTSKDYALLRAILYNDAKELDVAIEDVAPVVLGVVGSGGVYSYIDSEGEEVIVIKEFDPIVMNRQLYAAELLLNNIMVFEKGILYHSDMIYDDQYILTEIEPYHVFADVENGLYKLVDGNAYDSEDNLLFDSNCEYTGEVLVNDNGVFYLYDSLTEVEDIPYINAVFTDEMIEDDEVTDDQVGCAFEAALKELVSNHGTYAIGGDVIFVNGLDMASVDAGYAVDEEEVIETELTNFYGIGGNRFEKEQEYNRNHKFLLLNYNQVEVEDYINSITKYC